MMEGSVQPPSRNGCKEGAVRKIKKERGAPSGKSVVVLKSSDVTKQNGIVFMPNTIEMAQLKKPEKGQFKTNVQFSSRMTELEVSQTLMDTFPFLRDQRLYCAAAVDNRTRLDFHGQPRVWDGKFLKRKIKGNSAVYILTDKGEIAWEALQIAQSSSSSDTGFCDQEMDTSFNAPSTSQNTYIQDQIYPPNHEVPLDLIETHPGTFLVNDEDIARYLNADLQQESEPIDTTMDESSFLNSSWNDQIAMNSLTNQIPAVSTGTENGISSTGVVQNPDIYPKSSGMEGGEKFLISFTELLTPEVTSGRAEFEGVGIAQLRKVNPCGLAGIVPRSTKPGVVDVKVFDETGNCLGTTTFCYRGPWETLEQAVCIENLSMLFSMLAQTFQPLKVSVGDNDAAQGLGPLNIHYQGQTQQQQSLQLLQLLVYTAADTGAQEFIKIVFSTSAGRTVFYSYKDKTPLPEDVARANGHTYLAQYLQDVNTRLSKEVGSEAQSNAIDWLELVKAVQTQASAAQVKSVKEEKHPSESDDNSSDYFADSETSSHGSLGLDEANQPDSDSDSDSSIDKELCNIAGWYNEEPNKRPATWARQEGPSCETPEVEKPPNREDSGATRLDNKDRTPFEKEKPAADSKEERDYAVGWGLVNSLSQWLSTTRKKRKDETKSATLRRFNEATFFWGPFDKGDTSGQANVHSVENLQECTEKGHLSSQRRTAPDFKYSRIIMACVVLVVLVVLLVLVGIMRGIVSSRLSPPKEFPPPVLTSLPPSNTISSLPSLPPRGPPPSSTETQPSPTSRVTPSLESPFSVYETEALLSMRESVAEVHLSSQRRTAPDVKCSRIIMAYVLMALMGVLLVLLVLPVLTGIIQRIVCVAVSVRYAVYKVLGTSFSFLMNSKKVSQPPSEGFMEQLGQLDKGDTSGQANVHCGGYPHECAGKSHLSSQRRTAPDFLKYSRMIMLSVLMGVLPVLPVLTGIIQRIVWIIGVTIIALVWLYQDVINTGKRKRDEKCAGKSHLSSQRRTAPDFKYRRMIMLSVLMGVLPVLTGIIQRIVWIIGVTIVALVWLYQDVINTGKRKRDESVEAKGKSEKERECPDLSNFINITGESTKVRSRTFCRTLVDPLEHNEWEKKLTTKLFEIV